MELCCLETGCFCSDFTIILQLVASTGDSGSVFLIFFGSDHANRSSVGDFLSFWNLVAVDEEHGASAFDSFRAFRETFSNTLC